MWWVQTKQPHPPASRAVCSQASNAIKIESPHDAHPNVERAQQALISHLVRTERVVIMVTIGKRAHPT